MRYLKATLICGFIASIVAIGLLELGAFTGLDAALAGFIRRPGGATPPGKLQYLLAIILAFGISWTTIDIGKVSLKVVIGLAALAETVTAVWAANLNGAFFSPFTSLTAIIAAWTISFIYSQSTAGRRKRTINQLLGERVSVRTFQSLLDCDVPLKFQGEVREATVVVCEIFNHDELIETLKVHDYVAMSNAFLHNAADFLVERGAYLDECDGESLRVVFGAPLPDANHAACACKAALDLRERLAAVNQECLSLWGHTFDWRIGINSGDMVMAAYGSRRLGTFSVAGEPVEFARRLCAANTIYGSRILVGSGTFNLAESEIEVRPMELVQRHHDDSNREEVYELLGHRATFTDEEKAKRDMFWKGVVYYRERRWDDAISCFEAARDNTPGDEPIDYLMDRIKQMRGSKVEALEWSNAQI